jgi:hypothetical protein
MSFPKILVINTVLMFFPTKTSCSFLKFKYIFDYPFQPGLNDFLPGVLVRPFGYLYRAISRMCKIRNTKILTPIIQLL